MLIPVRCMSCGKMLADKWLHYRRRVRELKVEAGLPPDVPSVFDGKDARKTAERIAMDELGITRYCCSRTMLTSVDVIEKI